MKNLITEQICLWIAEYIKQTKDPTIQRIANRLSKSIPSATTIPVLIERLNEVIKNPNNASGQHLYGSIHFYNGLNDWKKRLEEQQKAIQEAIVILSKIQPTSKTVPVLTMLKAILEEPVTALHVQIQNLVNLIRCKHLTEILSLFAKLPILPLSVNPKEGNSVIEHNRSWCVTLLRALSSRTPEDHLITQLACNFILFFYTSEMDLIEIDLTAEEHVVHEERTRSSTNGECVIL